MRLLSLSCVLLCLAGCTAPPSQEVQPFGPSASEYARIVDESFAAKDWTAKTLPGRDCGPFYHIIPT